MQDASRRSDLVNTRRRTAQFWFSAVVLASVITEPLTAKLPAKDGPARKSKAAPRIAATVGEGTRFGSSPAGEKHPLLPALQVARSSKEAMGKVKDYSTVFIKQERIKDQLTTQTMDMKFRQEPFSVYLRYSEPHSGREVIYVDGQNKGNFLVHEDGLKALAGTLSFSPTSDEAMRENHYPVTKIGMANMLDTIIVQWEEEMKFGDIDVKHYPNAKVGDLECKLIVSTHAQPKPQFKFHKTCLYIDKASNLPIRVEQFGFPRASGEAPVLEEEYNYTNLKLNIGLTNRDFDPKNKNYAF